MKILLLALALVFTMLAYATPPAQNINHQITLKWEKPTSKFDGFIIYRADTCHDYILIKALGKVFTYKDQVVYGGETFKYKVHTILNGVESNDSNIVTQKVPY